MNGYLSSVVTGVAAKRLSAVEAHPEISNQHEFNGVQALKSLFGEERQRFPASFVYLGDTEDLVSTAQGFVTWYDAREEHPTRSEYRLYFPTTPASEKLRTGDLALILRRTDGRVLIAFAAVGSTAEKQLLWLFEVAAPSKGVAIKDVRSNDSSIGFAAREILDQLGIETLPEEPSVDAYLEVLLDRFGGGFPTTTEFSSFARAVTPEADAIEDPDEALIMWLEREEALFRILERHLVLRKLREGFGEDVDAFVQFSLSVQNRRKSRAGHALENHLQVVLEANAISFSKGQVTEQTSRPDFVFPSIDAYRDSASATAHLNMLAVKSTCKDRWRQILAEADRIESKHLLTLEPGISDAQIKEMLSRNVVLVIPRPLQDSFSRGNLQYLLSLSDFIQLRKSRE